MLHVTLNSTFLYFKGTETSKIFKNEFGKYPWYDLHKIFTHICFLLRYSREKLIFCHVRKSWTLFENIANLKKKPIVFYGKRDFL